MKRVLKEGICIFIDILGYGNKLRGVKKNNIEQMEFEQYCTTVCRENNYLKEICNIFEADIKIFSDNIVISICATTKNLNNFHFLLDHLIDYQKSLIEGNYFLRGGIAKGSLYHDKDFIYGLALVDAVKLEKETCYPFVSISDDILKMLDENNAIDDNDAKFGVPIINVTNQNFFLDYLFTMISKSNSDPQINYQFLSHHKSIIEHNLHLHINENEYPVRKKYERVADYHNQFCDYLKEIFPNSSAIENCCIDRKLYEEKIPLNKRRFVKLSIQ